METKDETVLKATETPEMESFKPTEEPVTETASKSREKIESENSEKDTQEVKSENAPAKKAGIAAIKKEFLLVDYKPSLSSEYISPEMKSKMAANKGDAPPAQDNGDEDKGGDGDNEVSEPPNKKAKLKGRNKQRPRIERIDAKDKMCPAVKENRECKFGDGCKFNHDKADFMSKKLPDLSGSCHIYDTYGFCQYGITCRFANNHLSESYENKVNNDLCEKMKGNKKFFNELDSEVRQKLWKKRYNFELADKAVKEVQRDFRGWGEDTLSDKTTASVINRNKTLGSVTCKGAEGGATVDVDLTLSESKTAEVPVAAAEPHDLNISGGVEARFVGSITDEEIIRVRPEEVKKIDLKNKLYLAPLTTVGNLPFRRICKDFGAEVTCGEMALVTQLLNAKQSEWSLIKRHPSEDIFGVQLCGSYPDTMTRCAQLLTETCSLDFIDINCGCPIDLIFKKGGGSALMAKATKLEQICRSMTEVMGSTALTVKLRKGVFDNRNVAHQIIPRLRDAGVSLVTVHGRSREQRYTRLADWEYIRQCADAGSPMPVFGNGDILSYEEANLHMQTHNVGGVMLARGALIKPWLFTEIREQRHWDISSNERLDMLRQFSNFGLEHWGSDLQGVENTRKFLLEWLSFLHRYIPVDVLEQPPQRINERPPYYIGRNDLETLMASGNCADWIKISEMLLGPVPPTFKFLPKHKANAYQ